MPGTLLSAFVDRFDVSVSIQGRALLYLSLRSALFLSILCESPSVHSSSFTSDLHKYKRLSDALYATTFQRDLDRKLVLLDCVSSWLSPAASDRSRHRIISEPYARSGFLCIFVASLLIIYPTYISLIKNVNGPKPTSLLFGNVVELFTQVSRPLKAHPHPGDASLLVS